MDRPLVYISIINLINSSQLCLSLSFIVRKSLTAFERDITVTSDDAASAARCTTDNMRLIPLESLNVHSERKVKHFRLFDLQIFATE